MSRFSISSFFIGLGMGLLLAYLFITFVFINSDELNSANISDDVIVRRAKALGMIDPYDGFNKENIRVNQ